MENMEMENLKLDIGCGTNKKPSIIGIDKLDVPGVDYIVAQIILFQKFTPITVLNTFVILPMCSQNLAAYARMVQKLKSGRRMHSAMRPLCRIINSFSLKIYIITYAAGIRIFGTKL
jgi:hypothetical protein